MSRPGMVLKTVIIIIGFDLKQNNNPGIFQLSLDARKLVFGVSDRVTHKPACTATKDKKFDILDV